MSKLSSWLQAHLDVPQVNIIPQAEQLAKAVANEILDKYRSAILSALDTAEQDGDALIDTGATAMTAFVDSRIAAIPEIPQSIVVLVQNFIEGFDTTVVEGDAKAKFNALIADVKQKVSQAQF